MRRILSLIILVAVVGCASDPKKDVVAATRDLPREVAQIVKRNVACSYWKRQMPDDPEDEDVKKTGVPQNVNAKLKKFNCTSLAGDEFKLRRQYKGNDDILTAMDKSEKLPYAKEDDF
jgi:hypothetical protein